MRKFILNSILFLSLFMVCNTIVYLFAKDVYHDSYNKTPEKSFDSFIFADSYGLPLSDYGEEYNLYNFAAASDSYFDIKRKITYLIRNDYQINKVYVGVDNHSLGTSREKMNNLDRSVYFSNTEDFNSSLAYFKHRYIVYYGAIFRPSVRSLLRSYLFQSTRSLLRGEPEIKSENIEWSDFSEERRRKEAEALVKLQFVSEERSILLEEALVDVIELSKTHGFELIGVKFPVTDSYLKALNNADFEAEQVFVSYGIPVLNHKREYIDENNLFADPNHLNDIGGETFIKVLLSE